MLILKKQIQFFFRCNWSINNHKFNCKFCFVLITILFFNLHNYAYADKEKKVVDKFKISLGSYKIIRYDSALSLTEPNIGAGVSISPEDTLGLRTEQTVLRLDGYYRFTRQHALTYSWYSINSTGDKSLEKEIDWVDDNNNPITIPVGANIQTSLGYDIYKIGYLWSFHHTEKVEMAVGAGLHITQLSLGLRSTTTSSGSDARDVSTSVPLPVLSFLMSYHITPKLFWNLKSEFFTLAFDDWEGTYTDSTLGIEYRALKNLGLGFGYGSNSLKLTEDARDYKFTFDNRISGLRLFISAYF